ncbi:ATP-binding cassette domain-containing protein [Actinokineospora bangkokensis]|uniref:ABC transporter domain-containing protein n=1 Tax=Actinokineospora bangkokensis TaxID=1193682 RepID=A0A1Q9LMD1_9PSEU|nr:ABC transporter ATP-binding protein [Actinokineospora bangkokensis]OLR93188.1 hypothetical protein BJP25_16965 [Actinokineospora bangkokensis]
MDLTVARALARAGGWRAGLAALLAVLQGVAPTAAVVATGQLIDAVVSSDSVGAVRGLVLFGVASVGGVVASAVLDHLVPALDGRHAAATHEAIADITLGTPGIAALEAPTTAAELAALAEAERADGFTRAAASAREVITRRTTGLAALVLLLSLAWWAPLVMVAGWRGMAVAVRRWIDHSAAVSAGAGASTLRRPRYLRELATGTEAAKEVRLYGLAGWLVRGYADTYHAALTALWRDRATDLRGIGAAVAGLGVAHLAVLGYAGWAAGTGAVSVAGLAVAVQAVLGSSALGFLGEPEYALGRAREVARRIQRLAAGTPPPRTPVIHEGRKGAGAIRLRGVRFTYPGRGEPTLDGIDLDVPAGQSIAVVGVNGAGKSTLVKLLCGLYDPDSGSVEVDTGLGVIFQNFTRYELPLRDNVSLTPRDEDTLVRALTSAGGADLVDLGWDTPLCAAQAGGRDVSGGQWQKVALARALAAVDDGAGVLVLDEPTAALDVRAEVELFDRFRAVAGSVTTVLVSHRMASVCRADRIVVLDGGRIAEDGAHAELMALGGRYAAMFTVQAARFAEVEEHSRG